MVQYVLPSVCAWLGIVDALHHTDNGWHRVGSIKTPYMRTHNENPSVARMEVGHHISVCFIITGTHKNHEGFFLR